MVRQFRQWTMRAYVDALLIANLEFYRFIQSAYGTIADG